MPVKWGTWYSQPSYLGFPNNFWTHYALHQNQLKLPSRKSLPRTRTSTNACAERPRDPGDGHFLGRFCCAVCLQTKFPQDLKNLTVYWFLIVSEIMFPIEHVKTLACQAEKRADERWYEHCQPWFMAKPSFKVITQHGFRTIPAR